MWRCVVVVTAEVQSPLSFICRVVLNIPLGMLERKLAPISPFPVRLLDQLIKVLVEPKHVVKLVGVWSQLMRVDPFLVRRDYF